MKPKKEIAAVSTSWSERLAAYRARLEQLTLDLGRIQRERDSLAILAADGDQPTIARLEQLASDQASTNRSISNLQTAIQQAQRGVDEEQAAEERVQAALRAKRIQAAVKKRIALSTAIDNCFAELARLFAEHSEATIALNVDLGATTVARRLMTPQLAMRSARHFRLHEYLELQHLSPSHQQPMAMSDRTLLAAYLEDAESTSTAA
jgi:chromosome segregation ATPase